MLFKDRFELGKYGAELANSYAILKLLSRQASSKYNRDVAHAAKGLNGNMDNVDVEEVMDKSDQVVSKMYDLIAGCVLGGKIYDDELKAERDLKPEDIDSFPQGIVKDMVAFVQGNLEKKS